STCPRTGPAGSAVPRAPTAPTSRRTGPGWRGRPGSPDGRAAGRLVTSGAAAQRGRREGAAAARDLPRHEVAVRLRVVTHNLTGERPMRVPARLSVICLASGLVLAQAAPAAQAAASSQAAPTAQAAQAAQAPQAAQAARARTAPPAHSAPAARAAANYPGGVQAR